MIYNVAVTEESWISRWDRLLLAGRERLGSVAELCREAGLNYQQVSGVKSKGPRSIGAGSIVKLTKAADFPADETTDLLYEWLALKMQRLGEPGRAAARGLEAMHAELARLDPDHGPQAARKIRETFVRYLLEEMQD